MKLSTDRITYLWHKENKIKAKQILSLKCDIVEISKTTKQGQQQKKTKQKKTQTNKQAIRNSIFNTNTQGKWSVKYHCTYLSNDWNSFNDFTVVEITRVLYVFLRMEFLFSRIMILYSALLNSFIYLLSVWNNFNDFTVIETTRACILKNSILIYSFQMPILWCLTRCNLWFCKSFTVTLGIN